MFGEYYKKQLFTEIGIEMILSSMFRSYECLWVTFHAFASLEGDLKLHGFSGMPGESPDLRTCTSEVVKFNQSKRAHHQDCKKMTQGESAQPGGPKGPAHFMTISIAGFSGAGQIIFSGF